MYQQPGGQYKEVKMQSAATATGNGTAADCIDVSGGAYTALTMQISGISGDTITFEATIDGSNWIAVQATNLNSAAAATTATANGIYRITCLGLVGVRARVSTYGAGTITITGLVTA